MPTSSSSVSTVPPLSRSIASKKACKSVTLFPYLPRHTAFQHYKDWYDTVKRQSQFSARHHRGVEVGDQHAHCVGFVLNGGEGRDLNMHNRCGIVSPSRSHPCAAPLLGVGGELSSSTT